MRLWPEPDWTDSSQIYSLKLMKRALFSVFILMALVVNAFMAQAHASPPVADYQVAEQAGHHAEQHVNHSNDCGGLHASSNPCSEKNCHEGPCSGGHCTTHHHHRGGCHHSASPYLRVASLADLTDSAARIYAERASQTLKPDPFLEGPFQPPRHNS